MKMGEGEVADEGSWPMKMAWMVQVNKSGTWKHGHKSCQIMLNGDEKSQLE